MSQFKVFGVDVQMARPRASHKNRNVKITDQAYDAARIAAGFTGESIVEFVSRIVAEHAERIIDEQYQLRRAAEPKRQIKKV